MNRSQDLSLKLLCNIDDEIIERNTRKRCELITKYKKRQKSMIIKLSAAAACFALVLTAVFGGIMLKNFGNDTPIQTPPNVIPTPPDDSFQHSDGVKLPKIYLNNGAYTSLFHVTIDGIFGIYSYPEYYSNYLSGSYIYVIDATVVHDFFAHVKEGSKIRLGVYFSKEIEIEKVKEVLSSIDEMFLYAEGEIEPVFIPYNAETGENNKIDIEDFWNIRDGLIPIVDGEVVFTELDSIVIKNSYNSENMAKFHTFHYSKYSVVNGDTTDQVYEFFNKLIEEKVIGQRSGRTGGSKSMSNEIGGCGCTCISRK